MNLLLVLVSSILVLNAVVSRRLLSINIVSTLCDLKYLSQEHSDMEERASDDTGTNEDVCDKIVQLIIKVLKDPELNLTPKQLRLIPTFNKKSISRHENFYDCPPDYNEWTQNLRDLEVSLTENQRETLETKIHQFFIQLMQNNT